MKCTIDRYPLETAKLKTISSDDEIDSTEFDGAFVRVKPIAGTTQLELKLLVNSLEKSGARAIRVLPIPSGDRVELRESTKQMIRLIDDPETDASAKQLLFSFIDQTVSNRKEEIRENFERLIKEVGL